MNEHEAEEFMDGSFVLVPPGNPKIADLIEHKLRYIPMNKINCEKGFCKWCYDRRVKSSRHLYCSIACTMSAYIYCFPHGAWTRKYLKKTRGNHCQDCGIVFGTLDRWGEVIRSEIDHIIPIHQGGVALGVENLQLLCKQCHRDKTIRERRKK